MADEDRAGQEDAGLDLAGPEETGLDEAADTSPRPEPVTAPRRSAIRGAMSAGLVAVAVFSGLCGLLGYRLIQARQAEDFRHEIVEVARQGAVNLTTIDYEHADADVQRILDSSTGAFYDDFKARSGPFADVVKKVKSKSAGTVTEAGLIPDSVSGSEGQVLVAVTVQTTNSGAPDEQPRYWRMRLTVTKAGDQTKVSKVDFVS